MTRPFFLSLYGLLAGIVLLAQQGLAGTTYSMEMGTNEAGQSIMMVKDASGNVISIYTNETASISNSADTAKSLDGKLSLPSESPTNASTQGFATDDSQDPEFTHFHSSDANGNTVTGIGLKSDDYSQERIHDSSGQWVNVSSQHVGNVSVQTARGTYRDSDGNNYVSSKLTKGDNYTSARIQDSHGNWINASSQQVGTVSIQTLKDSEGNIYRVEKQIIGDRLLTRTHHADGHITREWSAVTNE